MGESDGNPGWKLTTVPLNGVNYISWSRSALLAIGGKQKLGFIDGQSICPAKTDGKYAEWMGTDRLIRSWIFNSMEPRIADIFTFSESARELWDSIAELYGNQNNAARIFELKQEIAAADQGDKTFIEHLGSLKRMWDEHDMYRPWTADAKTLQKRAEEDKIFSLLSSLKTDYENLRSNILMNPSLPSLSSVCSIIQREETRKKTMNNDVKLSSERSESSVFLAEKDEKKKIFSTSKGKGQWNKNKGETFYCDHCEKKWHTRNTCWVLHPHLKPKPNVDGGNKREQVAVADTSISIQHLSHLLQQLSKSTVSQPDPSSSTHVSGNLQTSSSIDTWIIDSGATDHMANNSKSLFNFSPNSIKSIVSVANGSKVPVLGSGKVNLFSGCPSSNALFVPSFPTQLLSVGRITNSLNCNVIFSPTSVTFQDRTSGKKIGEGVYSHGLYLFQPSSTACHTSSQLESNVLHQRLGHPSKRVLSSLFPSLSIESTTCDVCQFAKQSRLPFSISESPSVELFELIHSDVWTSPIHSYDGYKYFVLFIDDRSRATWLYLLKSKNEVCSVFKDFHNMVINQFGAKVKTFRSDNGTEFVKGILPDYLRSHGIILQTSCVGTPQQNGVSERKNRHVLDVTRALMLQMNVPKKYWSHGVLAATYLINRLPSRVLSFKSPLEVLLHRKLNISHLRVFGCVCYVHRQAKYRDKLDARAIRCVFLGYSSTQKGYKCYDPSSKKIFISRDVRFDESKPFFQVPNETGNLPQGEESLSDLIPLPTTSIDFVGTKEGEPEQEQNNRTETEPVLAQTEPEQSNIAPDNTVRRRSSRESHPPSRMKDFFTYHATSYPIHAHVTYDNVSCAHAAFLSALSSVKEPTTFEEANSEPVWKQAMKDELQALDANRTWNIVKLPIGKKAVGSRWVYKIKYNNDGTIERYKARLVARGFTQTYGVDYTETFAPVAKMNTFRVLLSLAVNHDWKLYQMDVKNAFLHGDLEEEVYMSIPPGHHLANKPELACKLNKAIYGLKQSPRAWYAKLSHVLTKIGLQRSSADPSLFFQRGIAGTTIVLVYVDDIVITGDNQGEISKLKTLLHKQFAIKDLGILKYFLGLEVAYSKKGIFLNQRKYVLDLLQESGKMGVKPVDTPIESGGKLGLDGELLTDAGQFQRLVGKLIYLTITRPDISYAVSLVSRFMHAPTVNHMKAVHRILQYLKGSPGKGIWMKQNGHTLINAYTDADWAGCQIDRKSTTGYCTFVGGNLVTWKSKKQNVVARSSAEAEYRAMASTTGEIIWLRALLKDLGFSSPHPTNMYCDNQAAVHIASNPVFHERTKHIEVDCHFVRENVQAKIISTPYVRSSQQLADVFTKGLAAANFQAIISKLGLIDIFAPT